MFLHCQLSVFHFQLTWGFPQINIPEGLKMFTLHQKCRESLKKPFFTYVSVSNKITYRLPDNA